MDFNSQAGRLVIFAGYFLFLGFGALFLYLLMRGHEAYRLGISKVHPVACLVTATLFLLLLAFVASLAAPLLVPQS